MKKPVKIIGELPTGELVDISEEDMDFIKSREFKSIMITEILTKEEFIKSWG